MKVAPPGDRRASAGPRLVRGLQERAAHAFPVTAGRHLDGWWLRHSDSGAWWASSVLPHGAATRAELPARIAAVEHFYAARGGPARFQISPGVCPADLDAALAERGYRIESPMSLRTAPTGQVMDGSAVHGLRADVDDWPTEAWLATWHAVHGAGGDPGPARELLRRVDRPSAYAAVLIGADVVAVGRAVADTGWAGVFGMATLPQARGRGAAGQVLAALARWAARHGAANLYLQVEPDNAAALRVYDRAGFTELCRYHYRTAATTPSVVASAGV